MSRGIGIDLGTTDACVAVMEDGRPAVIPEEDPAARVSLALETGSRLLRQGIPG